MITDYTFLMIYAWGYTSCVIFYKRFGFVMKQIKAFMPITVNIIFNVSSVIKCIVKLIVKTINVYLLKWEVFLFIIDDLFFKELFNHTRIDIYFNL